MSRLNDECKPHLQSPAIMCKHSSTGPPRKLSIPHRYDTFVQSHSKTAPSARTSSQEPQRTHMKRPDDTPEGEPVPRRAARVILRDATNRVLLIRYDVSGYIFWTTPGGAIEPNETDLQAATRELYEELRITAPLTGPVHATVGRFHHEGAYVENTDIFFTAVIQHEAPRFYGVTPFESAAMREVRWWPLEEVHTTTERVFPTDLAGVLRRLQAADQ